MKTTSASLLLVCLVSLSTAAQDEHVRADLSLVQRHLTTVEHLANRASNGSVDAVGARYRFDYQRFSADLERVREGIQGYLSPSRAQPADLVELTGQYRAEAPHTSRSDEHD